MTVLLLVALVALALGFVLGRLAAGWSSHAPAAPPIVETGGTERLVSVLDGLSDGVVVTDRHGVVVHRNAAARTLAGTHAGLLIDATIDRHLERARAGEPTEELLDLYGPPKLVLVVLARSLPDGGAYALVEDISERRRIDAVRTDFVANISHELKTPVGALAVLAETLADETDPSVVARIAERMLEESHRASRTIDDLLELSRIELAADQRREDVVAGDIVRMAVARAAALAEQDDIRIHVSTGASTISLSGDRRQLVSAVGNLVENAVKYSEPGGRVDVGAEEHGGWVDFSVVDQGVGIPARDLDRIFERFYRVDKARSRGTGGTGLGLSIVRHVATNHAGEVLVSSREGEGSTFVLRIPRVATPAAELAPDGPTDEQVDERIESAGAPSVADGIERDRRGAIR